MQRFSHAALPLALALPTLSNALYIPSTPFDTIFQSIGSRFPSSWPASSSSLSSSLSPSSQQPLLRNQISMMGDNHQPNANQQPNDVGLTSHNTDNNNNNDNDNNLLLSDIIGKHRPISIFSSLTRDVPAATVLLEDPSRNAIVLAPVNSALQHLPRKPWEHERDYEAFGTEEAAYAGAAGSARAARNLESFVLGHFVMGSSWGEGRGEERQGEGKGEGGKVRTLGGGSGSGAGDDVAGKMGAKEIWWVERDGTIYVSCFEFLFFFYFATFCVVQ